MWSGCVLAMRAPFEYFRNGARLSALVFHGRQIAFVLHSNGQKI
jgi:hypothetical protein